MEAVISYHSATHSIPLCPHIAMGHGLFSDLWLLLHYLYWIFTGTSLGYPVIGLCHRDPTTLNMQNWSLHTFQPFIDGIIIGLGQLKALNLGMCGS